MARRHQLNNLKNIHEPYRCLALAVIAQAVAEDSPESCRWLQSSDPDLVMWCEVARIELEALHKRMSTEVVYG